MFVTLLLTTAYVALLAGLIRWIFGKPADHTDTPIL